LTGPARRWPTRSVCRCGRGEALHTIRRDGSRGGTDDGTCHGFVLDREEELPPATELRRRLHAVLALHPREQYGGRDVCGWCVDETEEPLPWPCPTVRAARGEEQM